MFEKEAEEYREKEKDKGDYLVTQEMEQSELDTIVDENFKDGAEFGYNKAKEEMQEQIEKMKSDVELARDNANKTEDWETFSVLNSILDDWEIKEND